MLRMTKSPLHTLNPDHTPFMKRIVRIAGLALAVVALGRPALAQTTTPAAATPGFDFSGVIFGSFSMKTDSAAKASLGGQNPSSFSADRAYLTFRMPAGDNGSIRVT